jgi:hypothetical protein
MQLTVIGYGKQCKTIFSSPNICAPDGQKKVPYHTVYYRGPSTVQCVRYVISVVDPDAHGSALIWLSWIRIRIGYAGSDPGLRKLNKIYK